MGINNLLKFMKPFIEQIHIKKYAGKRVGIDAYSWLHKGAYSCSMEICLNSDGNKKLQYLQYFMHRINMLRHYKITPVVVFDGARIPCKSVTEHERHRKRKANLDLAMSKLKEGDRSTASELFQRAVSITPSMAHELIQILRSENIEFVVAPYEADAQLAYLSSLDTEKGGIAAVITEDSDLLAYGCPAIIFKMDRHGNGEEILLDKVFDSLACKPSFRNLDKELFTGMCVLAGCDFLPSIHGIGIVKSYSLVSKYRNLDRVLSVLKFEKSKEMPEDYLKSFREAVAVFQHARIYDFDTKRLRLMKPLPQKLLQSLDGEFDFLGPCLVLKMDNTVDGRRVGSLFSHVYGYPLTATNAIREIPLSIATAIAEGKLDPLTMEAFDCFPISRCHLEPMRIQASDQLQRPDSPAVSTEESCFTILSSHKTAEKVLKVVEQKPVLERRKYLNEAMALAKIVSLTDEHGTIEKAIIPDEISLKVPNNNPFKKRKCNEVCLEQIQKECHPEQVSVVMTEVEEVDILTCSTLVSQESVNSKPNSIADVKERSRNVKKLKKSNGKSCESKNNSILNFFSRV